MFITIAGDLGSGKTTVGKRLAKKLEYQFLSVGDFMGEIAQEQNISLYELGKIAMNDNGKVDRLLDTKQIEFGKMQDNVVFDSRLGWHFIPDSIKIYLQVDIDVGAKRIYNDKREDEKENTTLKATKEYMIKRKASERERYKEYYNIDFDKPNNFDIVINTSLLSIEEVENKLLEEISKHKRNRFS
ncbi:MAG: (d)CMP kinase [Candidatus Nanoarchaeia archaeon]